MSVLLIDPVRSSIKKGSIWKAVHRELPTLGLAYIASFLERQGVEVHILDMKAQMIDISDIISALKEFKPDFVGIAANTVQINSALQLARDIKEFDKDLKIVMGGPHSHIFNRELLKLNYIDYVIRGEGEQTLWELVSGREPSSIDGLSYKVNKDIISNQDRKPIADLDSLPYPARHLLPMNNYRPSPGRYKRLPATSIITSRGCPGKCTFCYTDILGRTIRFRSARNIADEIKELSERYKIKDIVFYDDTFTVNRRNVRELCSIILDERIDVTWSCMSRVDCVDKTTLEMMKSAGCHLICYGVESGDKTILENINKKINSNQVKAAIELTRKSNITVAASFMLGNPGETKYTLQRTIDYSLELNLDLSVYSITTPYPGTAMYDWAKKHNYLGDLEWDDYDAAHVVLNLPSISKDTIETYYKKAYRMHYLRLGYLLNRLRKLRSPSEFFTEAKILFSLISMIS